jgi:hypothetical protein
MTLELWRQNAWLREYKTSQAEVASIRGLVDRDLADASREEISADWRFNIAYNAGLQLATLALYAAGYRAGRGESKRYRLIQTIPLVMGERFSAISAYLDNCRRRRNVSEYDAAGTVSKKEVTDLLQTVREFKTEVYKWLRENYPELHPRG